MRQIEWRRLVGAILITEGVGVLGGLATFPKVESWYAGLEKPFFSPPSWLFGPVWTILYLMMGVALYLGWEKKINLRWFWGQLGLNCLWSFVFFGMESPGLGLIEILILWGAIVMTIRGFWKKSKVAGGLLVPYLLWVSFASFLNAGVWWLNK